MDTVMVTALLAGLTLGLSCPPEPEPTQVEIELTQWTWLDEISGFLIVTSFDEADPFRTHGRIELSWADLEGKELFRALYNTSSQANPVPPEAFGVFDLEGGTVESAGIEGQWEVTADGFILLTDSVAVRRGGRLSVNWGIRPPPSFSDPTLLRARIIPKRSDGGEWTALGQLELVDGRWQLGTPPAPQMSPAN